MNKNEITLSIEIREVRDMFFVLKTTATKTKTGEQVYYEKAFATNKEALYVQEEINKNGMAFALKLFEFKDNATKYDPNLLGGWK